MHNNPSLLRVLTPARGGALTTTAGPQRIATRMAENLLDVARSQERALVAQRRHRIGDYEFREADYAQIQRWARMLGMDPEKVVEVLASSQKDVCIFDAAVEFSVQDGAIVSLLWDFALLPLTDWVWGSGLQIADLGILNAPPGAITFIARLSVRVVLLRQPVHKSYAPTRTAAAISHVLQQSTD